MSTLGITVTYNTSTDVLNFSGPASAVLNLTVSSPASDTVKLVLGGSSSVTDYFLTPDYPAGSPPSGSFTISQTTNPDDTLTILTDSAHAPVNPFDLSLGSATDTLNFSLAGTSGVGNVDITAPASDAVNFHSVNITGTLSDTGGAITVGPTSSITTGGGDIDLTGTGNAADGVGVNVYGASLDAGGGNVNLTGTGGGAGSSAYGVELQWGSTVVTGTGSITITGTGGGSGGGDTGVYGDSSSTVTGSGSVSISGSGGAEGDGDDPGVAIAGTISGSGTVTITGTGGSGGSSAGVSLASVTSTGAGVTITGTSIGGIDAGGDPGVTVSGTVSGSGAVTVTGTGASGEGGSDGVDLATVTSTTAGVTITGTAGAGEGVDITGTVSGSGAVSITGTGAGLEDGGEAGVSVASVISTSAGITITGSGGSTGDGSDLGVTISGTVSGSGAVTITGTGGGSGGSGGVSASGAISAGGVVTITGTGGSGSSSPGVSLASVTSTGAGVTISGSGSSTGTGGDFGVSITGTVSGSGAVTITATGGAGEGEDGGVSASSVSAGGTVMITGTGGAGGGNPGVSLGSVTSTGAGVTITGSGTGSSGSDPGVTVTGTISGSGAVAITGTGASGGGGSDGVDLFNVTSTSAGVTITGVSGTGNGVDITGSVSGSGAVTITGTGGGAESGEAGVQITGGSVSATSGGAVTITGSWSSGLSGDYGVELDNATITTGIPATNAVITGTASADGQNGVFIGSDGATMDLTLVSAPTPASTITLVHDVGGPISGTFSNIANGQVLSEAFGGKTYNLTASYTGGTGQDLVLSVPAAPTGSLVGTSSVAAASYNLTALGTSDWAHWGTGQNATAFDDKANIVSQISNVTPLGPGSYGAYSDPSRSVSWSDGTPLKTDTNDQTYIWANNAINAGYSFTVPAGTATQTVYVYLGGYDSGGTLTATLSDGSATPYSVSFSGSAHYTDLVAITYKAGISGQTLLLSYAKSPSIGVIGGSVDLIAAWLDGAPTAPGIVTSPKSTSVTAGSPVTFTASATGIPNPSVQWEISTNGGTTFNVIPGATSTTYSFTATLGENGDEYEAIFTNPQTYAITAPATLMVTPAGALSATSSTAAASYNLAAVGTTDWAHWGTGVNATAYDHKANVVSQISNVARLGSGGYGAYSDPSRSVSWTGGTPLATDNNDHAYVWANNAINAGYSFTVAASTTTHTLYVYLGGYSSGGTLTAQLSDGSAPALTPISFSGSAHYSDVVAITFKAGSAGQTLNLSYVKSQTIGSAGGSVDLIAAWLV